MKKNIMDKNMLKNLKEIIAEQKKQLEELYSISRRNTLLIYEITKFLKNNTEVFKKNTVETKSGEKK